MRARVLSLVCLAALAGCTATGGSPAEAVIPDNGPDLYPAQVGESWGFMDRTGAMTISPQFAGVRPFESGVSTVMIQGGKCGLIDKAGRFVIAPDYEVVFPPKEGLARFVQGGNSKVFYVGHYGFMGLDGKVVIKPKLDVAWDFSEGLAAAGRLQTENGPALIGFIDRSGRWVIQPIYQMTASPLQKMGFAEGVACVATEKGFGYIDKGGRWVIEPQFAVATDFHDGLAGVKRTARGNGELDAGLIDHSGKFVFEARFAFVGEFSEGLAPAATADNAEDEKPTWGYIDRTGKWIIEPRFYFATPMRGGWGLVQVRPWDNARMPLYRWFGAVSAKGKVLENDDYSFQDTFVGGLAAVNLRTGREYRTVYVDEDGKPALEARRTAVAP